MEAGISHEDPDPIRLCVKFNIAEPRFEVSKIISIYMGKGKTQCVTVNEFKSVHEMSLFMAWYFTFSSWIVICFVWFHVFSSDLAIQFPV